MLSLIPSLVLFALAGAISTVPVSITIMILLSPEPRRGAVPFLIGSIAGSNHCCRACRPSGCSSCRVRRHGSRTNSSRGSASWPASSSLPTPCTFSRTEARRDSAVLGQNEDEVPVRTPVGIRRPGPGAEPAAEGNPARRHSRGAYQRPGTAVAAGSFDRSRLRNGHAVSTSSCRSPYGCTPRSGPKCR